jgi:hypothetical protein
VRRSAVIGCLAAGAVVASAAAIAFGAGSARGHLRAVCGVERWAVKTLQDRPSLLPARPATVAYLTSLRPPHPLPLNRLPFERRIFRVQAAVTLVRSEADGDLHIVLDDGRETMLAEAPSSSCTARATALRRAQMSRARAAVRICARATVTGVAFFDFRHGQIGVAPNAIELHPVLGFRCEA